MKHSKKSVTGLMKQDHEVHRLENLVYKQKGSAYYCRQYGIDWSFFHDSNFNLPSGAVEHQLTQDASAHAIIISKIQTTASDFSLNYRIELLSGDLEYNAFKGVN